jgi:radical SAM superfamily enzyme YgiQ (UPF0313 family)
VIVLFNPRSTPSAKKPLPMSLLALAGVLEGRHEYAIVDGNLDAAPVARIAELGRRKRLDAVGVTVMPGPQLNEAVPQTRALRAALPDVPIVWGGYFPSLHDETCLKDPAIDFVVRSQGEATLLELLKVLKRGGDLADVQSLSWRDGGTFRRNPPRPLIPLDDLPDWPYESVPMERYIHSHYLGRRVGTHHSSYGCPFGCNFCAVVPMSNRRWLAQSPERLESILRLQKERYGIDAVQFHDMDFFVSEARTAEFAERVSRLGLSWWALGRVDELMKFGDATWQRMAKSGLKMIFCGAESGSDEVLKRMNKGGKAAASLTLELARRMGSLGIVPEFSFVLGNPPDPDRDVSATLAFIRKLKQVNPATEMILYAYTPVPIEGTLYDEARALGFKFPESLDEWVSGDWRHFSLRREPHTPWLGARLQRRIRNFERVVNAYYPTVTDLKLSGLRRSVLRALGSWRYHLRLYAMPLELRAFHKLVGYQRPETAGF